MNRRAIGVLIAGLTLLIGSFFLQPSRREEPPGPVSVETSLRPYPASEFTNARLNVSYTGSAACVDCHQETCGSYHETQHAQALSDAALAQSLPPATFDDPQTGRRYLVEHKDGRLWHRELLPLKDGSSLTLAEFPMRYGLGSGTHWQTFLVEADGFIMESPVTWYASQDGWALSPGYQHGNVGFQRSIDVSCLFCHAGPVEPVDGSYHRVRIGETGISCERCHGPGSLHVARHQAGETLPGQFDNTIVNPRRLPRNLQEDICAQCHLRSAATVELAGRERQQFRPGLPLNEFRIDYALAQGNKPMKVVGHVEQMRMSRCWQESTTLTCVTCHQPHQKLSASERDVFQRQQCLTCHAENSCGLPVADREKTSAADSCVQCHMPGSPIDVPHFAFTHHRIGIHSGNADTAASTRPLELVPLAETSHLTEFERQRSLGLAYLEAADRQPSRESVQRFLDRAHALLMECRQEKINDAGVETGLAQIAWAHDPALAARHGEQALQSDGLTPALKLNALVAAATGSFNSSNRHQAITALDQLTRLRRAGEDHFLLALCYANASQWNEAIAAASMAAEISPERPEILEVLANLLHQHGDHEQARQVEQRLQQLRSATKPPRSNP